MSLEPSAMGELLSEATLEDCERIFRQGDQMEKRGTLQQGLALAHIHDNGLYRQTHSTFENYLEERLRIVRTRGYQLISLAKTVQEMSTNVDTPAITNEGQARAIKPVLRDHGPEVAAEVLREAADDSGRITARSITEATARVIEPDVDTVAADDYIAALERYPALDVAGAEAGDVVEIAAAIDARPAHERAKRTEIGAKYLTAKAEGRLASPLDDVDAEDLIPAALRFKRRFWKHMVATHDLLLDADFPEHFDEEMLDSLADFSASIARKVAALTQSRRSLRVISGGTQ